MKTSKTTAAFLAATLIAAALPASAGADRQYYEHNRGNYITREKAAQIASNKVGGGTAVEVEFDRSRSKPDHFDVEIRKADGRKYDVEVNARTGEVLSSRLDD